MRIRASTARPPCVWPCLAVLGPTHIPCRSRSPPPLARGLPARTGQASLPPLHPLLPRALASPSVTLRAQPAHRGRVRAGAQGRQGPPKLCFVSLMLASKTSAKLYVATPVRRMQDSVIGGESVARCHGGLRDGERERERGRGPRGCPLAALAHTTQYGQERGHSFCCTLLLQTLLVLCLVIEQRMRGVA
jgi:hypothetical protein